MGYSDDPAMVRVDFFKDSGKWYATEAIPWLNYGGEIFSEFRKSLAAALGGRFAGMYAVCLEPYNARPFPLMIKIEDSDAG